MKMTMSINIIDKGHYVKSKNPYKCMNYSYWQGL